MKRERKPLGKKLPLMRMTDLMEAGYAEVERIARPNGGYLSFDVRWYLHRALEYGLAHLQDALTEFFDGVDRDIGKRNASDFIRAIGLYGSDEACRRDGHDCSGAQNAMRRAEESLTESDDLHPPVIES
jgi:hypothetical protein